MSSLTIRLSVERLEERETPSPIDSIPIDPGAPPPPAPVVSPAPPTGPVAPVPGVGWF